jgi:hypothetical protein
MKALGQCVVGSRNRYADLTRSALTVETSLKPEAAVLIKHARVFDGNSHVLSGPTSVLIVWNKIAKIAAKITAPDDANQQRR